jgi:hypothetical protein
MTLNFDIQSHYQNTFGHFIVGEFLEQPPYFVSDQKFRVGEFEFEMWGVLKDKNCTLKLVTEKELNWVLEEQVLKFEIL